MQSHAPLTLLLVATAVVASLAAACAAPALATGSGQDEVNAAPAKKKKKATPAATATKPPTGETGDDDDDSAGPGPGGPKKTDPAAKQQQCMTTCIGGDRKAAEIMATFDTCFAKCGSAATCSDTCFAEVQPACQASPDSCTALDDCAAKCQPASTDPGGSSSGGTPNAVSFTDVSAILAQNCSGCHRGQFTSLDQVRTKRDAIVGRVSTGDMPEGQPTWFQTADGQKLLSYLESSPDLQ